jgi:hypothetical protein
MSDVVSGPASAAVQAIHPPAAVLSTMLEEASLPASPERPASMQHYITCIPSDSFGKPDAKEHWCKELDRGGSIAGDGTLTTFMMELSGPGWARSIQVRHLSLIRQSSSPTALLPCFTATPPRSHAPGHDSSSKGMLCLLINGMFALLCRANALLFVNAEPKR